MTPAAPGVGARRFVEIDGLRIRVFVHEDRNEDRRAATGPVVVLLHGVGGNYLTWPPQLRRMPGALVIAPDLPGHGESAGKGYDTTRGYAGFVADLLGKLGVSQPVVVGHSLGAAIALDYAHVAGDGVAAVGLLAGGEVMPISSDLLDAIRNDYCGATQRIAGASAPSDAPAHRRSLYLERLRRTDPDVLYRDVEACLAFDARPYASDVHTPALIVAGTDDRVVPPSCSQALHDRMPHSELQLLQDAGHMFLWERTDQVLRLVQQLVARTNHGTMGLAEPCTR